MKSSRKIILRKASFSDIEFLWYLRNQLDVYKYSRQNKGVEWEEHLMWIIPIVLGLSNKELFIIQKFSGDPIGQIRIDYDKTEKGEVSISVIKEFRRKGLAIKAMGLAIDKIRKNKKAKSLIAVVNKQNLASVKFFEKLGFCLKEEKKNWLKYSFPIKNDKS